VTVTTTSAARCIEWQHCETTRRCRWDHGCGDTDLCAAFRRRARVHGKRNLLAKSVRQFCPHRQCRVLPELDTDLSECGGAHSETQRSRDGGPRRRRPAGGPRVHLHVSIPQPECTTYCLLVFRGSLTTGDNSVHHRPSAEMPGRSPRNAHVVNWHSGRARFARKCVTFEHVLKTTRSAGPAEHPAAVAAVSDQEKSLPATHDALQRFL